MLMAIKFDCLYFRFIGWDLEYVCQEIFPDKPQQTELKTQIV